jgi:hypothetical protein
MEPAVCYATAGVAEDAVDRRSDGFAMSFSQVKTARAARERRTPNQSLCMCIAKILSRESSYG